MHFIVFTQKTAYEMRMSDWSSDVCSSDLVQIDELAEAPMPEPRLRAQSQFDRHPAQIGRQIDAGEEPAILRLLVDHLIDGMIQRLETGRGPCREREGQYVLI